jgi:hypothetical protein
MSCILRVGGASLSVDDLARSSTLKPYRIDRKGELARIRSRGMNSRSAAHFLVSGREFDDLPGQISEAIAFLGTHGGAIRDLVAFPGVDGAVLDFGADWRDVAVQTDRFPAELLRLAGSLGLDLEITHYPLAEPSTAEGAGA